MKLLKISNWLTERGSADYKGLDIDLFVPGTQIYPDHSVCYIGTDQDDIPQHADIEEITQEQYDDVIASLPEPVDPLQELKDENARLAAADLDNKEAIATLYEMMLGGI